MTGLEEESNDHDEDLNRDLQHSCLDDGGWEKDYAEKAAIIRNVASCDQVDVATLRRLAIARGGLVSNELRRLAWPKLLGLPHTPSPLLVDEADLVNHRDYRQVVLDVSRSLRRFPPGMKDEERLVLQDQCVRTIMRVLVKHNHLYYYQGYHDICVTLLLVVGEELGFVLLDKLSTQHLRQFMDSTMERTRFMLSYLFPIIGRADPALRLFMERSEVNTIFALSWLITWYGHVLGEFRQIVRLYDFFMACDPLMPVYLAAAIVLKRREEVIKEECEMCYIHALLSRIPDTLPYEEMICEAGDLYLRYPPRDLAADAEAWYKESTAPRVSRKPRTAPATESPGRLFVIGLIVGTLLAAAGAVTLALTLDDEWWLLL